MSVVLKKVIMQNFHTKTKMVKMEEMDRKLMLRMVNQHLINTNNLSHNRAFVVLGTDHLYTANGDADTNNAIYSHSNTRGLAIYLNL